MEELLTMEEEYIKEVLDLLLFRSPLVLRSSKISKQVKEEVSSIKQIHQALLPLIANTKTSIQLLVVLAI